MSPRPRTAVIGLGAMGLPMATRLAAHLPVTAFDVAEGRLDRLATARGTPAA
ncbi:NAD(P)-binding domain-containing protein, partial [Streptomyces chartreusis]|uniref:NAD(P)-binding domain-containing protein n=1 Tax=Streptomyces chartreusis TaxID=1969 RepID=UPI0036850ED5